MKTLNEVLSNNPVESVSNKVQSLMTNTNSTKSLMLPKKNYEPFLLKIFSDFRAYHNLPDTIPPPSAGVMIHAVFSYIAELMVQSMGSEKHQELIRELEEYKQGLPFDIR